MIKNIFLIGFLYSVLAFGQDTVPNISDIPNLPNLPSIPIVPMLPATPIEKVEDVVLENGEVKEEVWELVKTNTIMLKSSVEVVVPLEIMTDINVTALVIDDQKLEIPFEITMNKEPDKKDYYSLNYSETAIDIDKDGKIDTYISSPKYINKKVVDDNILIINGKNITVEGTHRKKIYINIEMKNRR
ncbi:MAG: hypothetical protein ACRCZO_10480 [Cetobacterium sp.]